MEAITAKYIVILMRGGENTGANGFLADVEMQETAYALFRIGTSGFLFKTPHEVHLTIEVEEFAAIHMTNPYRCCVNRLTFKRKHN